MALALVNELSGPFSVARCRKPLYGRPAALLDDSFDIRIAAVDYDTSVGWQRAHELVKLPLDVIEIVIDICMIEFEIVDELGLWSLVHNLGTLIEKRRIVLVRLNDEILGRSKPR